MNSSEERTLEIHLGVESRATWCDEGIGEDVNMMAGEPGKELLNTFKL